MTNRKRLFDWVRAKMGRGFTQAEVAQLDAILDARAEPDAPGIPEQAHTPETISETGKGLIKRFEGCARRRTDGKLAAYWDAHGQVWTIGWGATGQGIASDTVWTQEQADAWFDEHIERYAGYVRDALGDAQGATSQAQFDALVSFTYNCGPANLVRSTLLRKHVAGMYASAASEFARWNKSGGQVLAGLTRRRAAEAELYRSGS